MGDISTLVEILTPQFVLRRDVSDMGETREHEFVNRLSGVRSSPSAFLLLSSSSGLRSHFKDFL
jgi:hypothetical protein